MARMVEQITPQTQAGAMDMSGLFANLMPMITTLFNMMFMFKMLSMLFSLLKGVF